MTLETLFKGRMVDISGMMARLRKAAEAEGLPFGERNMTYNSRLAQELGKWAETKGNIEAFNQVVFQAYFAEGRNIGEMAELIEIAKSVGLNPEEALQVLKDRSFKHAVDADWERSRRAGITAVPTFVMKDQMLVGAQPEDALDAFIRSGKGTNF
jgi:predicted DsbA family dithiol-disulfide isomerase